MNRQKKSKVEKRKKAKAANSGKTSINGLNLPEEKARVFSDEEKEVLLSGKDKKWFLEEETKEKIKNNEPLDKKELYRAERILEGHQQEIF